MSGLTPSPSLLPFDDIRALVDQMPGIDDQALAGFAAGAGPADGRVAEVGSWMAGWQGQTRPTLRRPVVALFAASHAIAAELADSMQIAEVVELVSALQAQAGPAAALCQRAGLGLKVFELAPELPVDDFSQGSALQESDCAATIAYGMEATTDGCDFLVLRAVAAGDQASITALAAALLGSDPSLDKLRDRAELDIVKRALKTHAPARQAPLEVLRRLGGREAAAIAGAILAARLQRVPVVLDGSLAVCVAVLLEKLRAGAGDHCMIAARDMHPDSERLCHALGRPVLLSGRFQGHDTTAGALAASLVANIITLSGDAG